jgi:protein-tyrosine phosphatase
VNVLFVCTGNTCRSPMAEHLLRKMAADEGLTRVAVQSAGVSPATGLRFPTEAAAVLAEENVRDARHRPQGLSDALIDWAQLILAMEPVHHDIVLARFPRAAGKTHVLKSHAGLGGAPGIADPYGGSEEDYRRALSEIKPALQALVNKWKTSPAEPERT